MKKLTRGQLANALTFTKQWDRLRIEQPSAVTDTLEAWLQLKLSMTAGDANIAAAWARERLA